MFIISPSETDVDGPSPRKSSEAPIRIAPPKSRMNIISRYELMFGAISVDDDLPRLAAAQPRDVDEVARLQREGLRPHRPRRPGPGGQADQDRLRHVAVHVHVGGDDDQDRQRRDHEHDVREHVQHVVEPAAAVAGGEADGGADQPGDPAADGADEERRAQAVDELREDVLAERGRAEPVVGRRAAGRSGPLNSSGWCVGEQRAEEREREQDEDDGERRATNFQFRSAK